MTTEVVDNYSGEWICERHPLLPFEHSDECPGPGMPRIDDPVTLAFAAYTAQISIAGDTDEHDRAYGPEWWAEVQEKRDRVIEAVLGERLYVIFDGPPSHESGRFVEVEDTNGASASVGEWHELEDGLWSLGPVYRGRAE